MSFNITRMTAYALISALEEDLRNIILDNNIELKFIHSELVEKATARLESDLGMPLDEQELADLINYFDLGDTIQVVNKNKEKLPKNITKSIKQHTSDFERIIKIRNRVMHIRPLEYTDLPECSEFCNMLVKSDPLIWGCLKDVIHNLAKDPSFVLSMEIKVFNEQTNVMHNLPLPDFDETGLIGRDKDVSKIKSLCLGAFPVISIVGEGGIGKTALALKVAYELLEEDAAFDAVVWVSSKTTQLSVNEIKEIKNSITSSINVLEEVSEQLTGNSKDNTDFDEIIEYLATFRVALFIDNLETILDDNIRDFVGSLPSGSKIIITSRIGLGAYEYPVKLYGLDEAYASQLLRAFSKVRNVKSLSTIEEKISRSYVTRMHCNPSYIKWFVNSVQAGSSIETTLQNSELFLEFCMSNVYDYLSEDAKYLTTALQCAPGYRDIPELAYITKFNGIKIQKAVQELQTTNMLIESSKKKDNSVKHTYQLSELARSYLNKKHRPSKGIQADIRKRLNRLNSIFEQQIAKRTNDKFNPYNFTFRDKSDRVAVKMLSDALVSQRQGDIERALNILDEVKKVSPDYFEVARVAAYLAQKSGNFQDARDNYELSITLSPNTPQLHYWFGKFILHAEENVDGAVHQFESAYKIEPKSLDVCIALSRGYMFQHNFDKARDILESIKDEALDSDDKYSKQYYDTDIQIYYRIADDYSIQGNIKESLASLQLMRNAFDSIPCHLKDSYIRRKLNKCTVTLSRLTKFANHDTATVVSGMSTWLQNESR